MTSTPITREDLERLTMDCLVIARNTEGAGRSDMIKLLPTHKDLLSFIDRYTNAKVLEELESIKDNYRSHDTIHHGTVIEWRDIVTRISQLKKEQE